MSRSHCGPLVREWRSRRRRSQLDLALDVGVSTRHLSFVETGRSRPSPELLLTIADRLDIPLRERNSLLLAAGYAPRYTERSLDDPSMAAVRDSLTRLLEAHDPYPGVVVDRQWNVVLANRAAGLLVEGMPADVLGPVLNVYRVGLHPQGLGARVVNFADWARFLLAQLRRSIVRSRDPALRALWDEVTGYAQVAEVVAARDVDAGDEAPLLVPVRLRAGDDEWSLYTTLTTFGTPRDVTLDELAVELFYPADGATAAALASRLGV